MNESDWTEDLRPGDTVWAEESVHKVDAIGEERVYLTSGYWIKRTDGSLHSEDRLYSHPVGRAWPSREARNRGQKGLALYRRLRRAIEKQAAYPGSSEEDIRQAASLLRVDLEEEGAE